MPRVISLFDSIKVGLTCAEISSIETTLKVSNGDAEGERIVSGFVHALSMAHNRAKVKGLWTLAQASQLMEHLRFAYKNAVNLSGFVTLTLAEFVTPKQVTHGLVVDSECDVVEFNLRSHD